jgi:hypothetical protein
MKFIGTITAINKMPEGITMSSSLSMSGSIGDYHHDIIHYGTLKNILDIFNIYGFDKTIEIKIGEE